MAEEVSLHRRVMRALMGRRSAIGRFRSSPECFRALACAMVPLFASLPSEAQEWKRDLRLDVSTIISDNPLLRRRGSETSDITLRTSPSIGLKRDTGRLRFDGRYSPVVVGYLNDTREESLFNLLNAQGTYEVSDRRAYVDGRALINQTFLSPFGSQPSEFATSSLNRTEVRTISLSPYLKGPLSGGGQYLLRNDNSYTTFTSRTVVDITSHRFAGQVNGPTGNALLWSGDASYGITSYGSGSNLVNQSASARLSLNLDPEFVPYVTGGYEYNEFFLAKFSGPRYGGGFRWQPSPRTIVDMGAENRYFGTSFNVDVSYRTRLSLWQLRAYRNDRISQQGGFGAEAVSTREYLSNLLRSRFPDENQRETEVNRLMTTGLLPETLSARSAFSSPRVLLVEAFEPSVALNGLRNTIVLGYFWRKTTPLSSNPGIGTTDVFNVVNGFQQQGVSVSWTHQVTERTSFVAGLDQFETRSILSTTALPARLKTDQSVMRFFVTHQLTPDTTATAGLRFTRVSTDNSSASGFDSRERAIQFTVAHQFF